MSIAVLSPSLNDIRFYFLIYFNILDIAENWIALEKKLSDLIEAHEEVLYRKASLLLVLLRSLSHNTLVDG